MKKGFSILFFLAFALGLYCLAPIIPPPSSGGGPETDPVYGAALDTDGTLAANSDAKVATQKAAKTYSDTKQTAAQVQALIDAASPKVIGTASFTAVGSIADLVVTGIVSNVTATATGVFEISFGVAQPDSNYGVTPSCYRAGFGLAQAGAKSTSGCTVTTVKASDQTETDPELVTVIFTR